MFRVAFAKVGNRTLTESYVNRFSEVSIVEVYVSPYLKESATNSHRWLGVSSEQFHQGKKRAPGCPIMSELRSRC